MIKRAFSSLAILCCCLLVSSAMAQTVDDETRGAARSLANEGSELYKARRFDEAHDRFSRAYELVRLPRLGIWAARALVEAGHWVQASELYLDLGKRTDVQEPPDVQAVQDAATEREKLMGRIPKVTLRVDGAKPADVVVTLDGKVVPTALLGVPRLIDPGEHVVRAVRGEEVLDGAVKVPEGQAREVALRFHPQGVSKTAGRSPGKSQQGLFVTEADVPPDEQGKPTTLAWVTLGVGGALLVGGVAAGVVAASRASDLDANCPDHRCAPAYHGDVDAYDTLKLLSTVGVLGGAAIGGYGAYLVLGAGQDDDSEQARIEPWVGLGSAGVRGSF